MLSKEPHVQSTERLDYGKTVLISNQNEKELKSQLSKLDLHKVTGIEPTPLEKYSDAYLGLDVILKHQNTDKVLYPLESLRTEASIMLKGQKHINIRQLKTTLPSNRNSNSVLKKFNDLQIQS